MEEPDKPLAPVTSWFAGIFIAVVILTGVVEFVLAYREQNMNAFGIALVVGPALNGIFALAGILGACFVPRSDRIYIIGVALALPILVCVSLIIGVFSLDIRDG